MASENFASARVFKPSIESNVINGIGVGVHPINELHDEVKETDAEKQLFSTITSKPVVANEYIGCQSPNLQVQLSSTSHSSVALER